MTSSCFCSLSNDQSENNYYKVYSCKGTNESVIPFLSAETGVNDGNAVRGRHCKACRRAAATPAAIRTELETTNLQENHEPWGTHEERFLRRLIFK